MIRGALKGWLGPYTCRALRQAVAEFRLHRLHLRSTRLVRQLCNPSRLHLGCGEVIRAGWINVDLFEPQADLQLDLREPFPFPKDTVSLVYSEHFLEHLDYPREVDHLLKESLRVLTPGGQFSVGVPDAAASVRNYMRADREAFARFAVSNP